MITVMDLTVLNLAVPHLTVALAPTGVQLLWIVDIYGFVLAGALIPIGGLGDRIGRRKLLVVGGAAFGLASLTSAFSTSALMLILARALLGVAGAAVVPSTLSLLSTLFEDAAERTKAIGVWGASFAVGAAIGMALPSTYRERELMGEARDKLMERAQGVVQQAGEKVQRVAEEAGSAAQEAAKQEAKDQGLTGQQSGSSTSGSTSGSSGKSGGSSGSTGTSGTSGSSYATSGTGSSTTERSGSSGTSHS